MLHLNTLYVLVALNGAEALSPVLAVICRGPLNVHHVVHVVELVQASSELGLTATG